MIGQTQIQQSQPTSAPGFGGIEDHMNAASSVIGFQHPSTPVPGSHAKLVEDLRKQVEFYFGPSNYPNDAYLQQLAAGYGGSVPTVVILGFPKVRAIFASAAPIQHGMNQQQAEIQLLATSLATSEFVHLTPDGHWILAPGPPHHHQQIMHHHHHHQRYGMSVPAPQDQNNTKGNIRNPYSVLSLHHNNGMMFSNGAAVPYGIAPQYPPHALQMDHPQHLLPRYHVSMNGSNHNNHSHTNHRHNHKHQHQHADPKHHQHQRRYSQGSTKSEGAGHNNNNNHGQNHNNKNKKRQKKPRASWTAENSVASTGSGGSAGGNSGSDKRSDQQGPLERRPSSNSSFDNNDGGSSSTNSNHKDKASGNATTNNKNNNNNNSNNANKQNNHKNKKTQRKDKKLKQQGSRPALSSSNKSSETLSDEHFPSLPNQKGQEKKSLSMSHVDKVVVSGVIVEDTLNNKSAQPYAQALLKSTTTGTLSGPSSGDSTATTTTVNTLNTEMEKLAMDATEDKEEMCW